MGMLSMLGDRINMDSKRHEIIAGNIANAQTPGYLAKDLAKKSHFGDLLSLSKTSVAHLSGSSLNNNGALVRDRDDNSLSSLDGNNVDLDKERGLMAQNALDLEAHVRFATHYLRQQQAAAS